MDIFKKIEATKKLSANERIIADYIMNYPDRVIKMNTSELSKACYVSTSTIYRLCDKLGLSGYSELKLQISSAIDSYMKHRDFDFNFPIKQYQTHYEIISYLKEDYEKTITSTFGYFDLDQLRLITSAMLKAKSIDIYTSAGNVYFAENFRFQMAEIGVPVHVPVDEYEQRLLAASSDRSHFAIVISFGGRGLNVKTVPVILKDTHTPILLISSPEFHLPEADYQLYISPQENHYNKISSYATRLSILYILDVLYTCYFERNYEENMKKKIKYYTRMRRASMKET